LAASFLERVIVWDTSTWDTLHRIEVPVGDNFSEVTFTHDGLEVGLGVESGGVMMYDLESGKLRSVAAGTVNPAGKYNNNGLEFTTDGRYVVAAGLLGANFVDVESGHLIGSAFPSNGQFEFGSSVGHEARFLVTSTDDHILVWNLDPEMWTETACRAAGRNMTLDEWGQFGWPDEPYHATCSQWPAAIPSDS